MMPPTKKPAWPPAKPSGGGMAPPSGSPFKQKPPMVPFGGKMPGKMMADGGGLGAPAPIGSGGPPMPPAGAAGAAGPGAAPPMGGAEPDMDDTGAPAIQPEAVHYHDDAQSCQMCQFMDEGGQCSVLQMQVSPDGGCAAYEAKGGDQGQGGMMPGEDAGGMDDGTSGGQQ